MKVQDLKAKCDTHGEQLVTAIDVMVSGDVDITLSCGCEYRLS